MNFFKKIIKKIVTVFKLLVFDRKSLVERIFFNYFGRFDIFLFYYVTKTRSFFLSRKKRLFIDLGSNTGQAYHFFSKIYPINNYDYILVEANINCVKILRNKIDHSNVKILNKAAWIEDGDKLLYGISESNNPLTEGASILKDHKNISYIADSNLAINVKTFDFSDFINHQRKEYSEIIVKMDIESSEYDVLEKLISDNNLKYISRIFIEFHSGWMKDSEKKAEFVKREKHLINEMPKHTKVHLWI